MKQSDYKLLLKKYMAHIIKWYGNQASVDQPLHFDDLSPADREELKSIENEINSLKKTEFGRIFDVNEI